MTEDEQLSAAQGFSEKYAILERRVSQDANASYQLCKRDHAFCTDVVKLYQIAAQRDQNVEAQFRLGVAYTTDVPSFKFPPAGRSNHMATESGGA